MLSLLHLFHLFIINRFYCKFLQTLMKLMNKSLAEGTFPAVLNVILAPPFFFSSKQHRLIRSAPESPGRSFISQGTGREMQIPLLTTYTKPSHLRLFSGNFPFSQFPNIHLSLNKQIHTCPPLTFTCPFSSKTRKRKRDSYTHIPPR